MIRFQDTGRKARALLEGAMIVVFDPDYPHETLRVCGSRREAAAYIRWLRDESAVVSCQYPVIVWA